MKTLKKMLAVLVVAMLLMTSAMSAMAVTPQNFSLTLTCDNNYAHTATQQMEVDTMPYVNVTNRIVDEGATAVLVSFAIYELSDPMYGPDPTSDTRITNTWTSFGAARYNFTYENGYGTSTHPEDRYYLYACAAHDDYAGALRIAGVWNV